MPASIAGVDPIRKLNLLKESRLGGASIEGGAIFHSDPRSLAVLCFDSESLAVVTLGGGQSNV